MPFTFNISLSVLNHLGRNLYRSFLTVLGEAISNSWDADAKNVWIYIDRDENYLVIKDDGLGMTEEDFQNKFLKIGYTKRNDSGTHSQGNRPYIGRKGIGKLAMLSCANRISIITKTETTEYVGGSIDNSDLDEAITQDMTPQEYQLGTLNNELFSKYKNNHDKGTIIYFEGLKEGIKNTIEYLRYAIALFFRFSLIDPNFNLYLRDELITVEDLDKLAERTQFLWTINELEDPYIERLRYNFNLLEQESFQIDNNIRGFIASVEKPSYLKALGTEEKASIDLFVNGRLRERDILKHIPTARIVENYIYGQIHFDELDDEEDRFATAREGLKVDDPKFSSLLKIIQDNILNKVIEDWDKWRVKHRYDGDVDNQRMRKKARKSKELFNLVAEEYTEPPISVGPPSDGGSVPPDDIDSKTRINEWVNELSDDAEFNFSSYADCFVSENLIRKFIYDRKLKLSPEAIEEVKKYQDAEARNKQKGNVSIDIRKVIIDLSYLSMDGLAYLVDKRDAIKEACLARDANEYKPIRDALAHTALLTDEAKQKLNSVYHNIKGRIRTLLYTPSDIDD